MATSSPSPNSPPTAMPPISKDPPPVTSPPSPTPEQPQSPPPPPSPPAASPLPQSPPSPVSPPPQARNSPPPIMPPLSPPLTIAPQPQSPPPVSSNTSPPPSTLNPPVMSPPPPSPYPPSSPPPSSPDPPISSPSPPSSTSPASSPPHLSPNPPTRSPPSKSPPPPSPTSPDISPPRSLPSPPARSPPLKSPPPLLANPPSSSPPSTSPQPPGLAPPPSRLTPSPPRAVPSLNSPPPSIFSPTTPAPPPSLFSLTPPAPPPSLFIPTPPASPAPSSSNLPKSSLPPIALSPPPSQILVPPSGNPTNNDSTPNAPSSNGGIGTGGVVAIGLVLGFVMLCVIGVCVWCMKKRRGKVSGGSHVMPTSLGSMPTASDSVLIKVETSTDQTGSSSANDSVYTPTEPGGLGNSRSRFAYEELIEATNGFSAENLLGEGGFGSVYKGYMADGKEVAVKQLKIGGGQGEREFRAEVEIISRIHHRHLVSLVGYCISDNRRLLVYDYVPNHNLYFHLHGSDTHVMDWATRVKVASGAARGIAYLHEDCHPRIIHRDIKSSNILLDENFEARVSDFGLAKLTADANTHITTRVMGTFGYMAPEYASSGKLTEKSDVYSFGVVILELITGRKPVDASQPLGDESLVEWARPLLSNSLETEQFERLVDPRLEHNYVDSEMFTMCEVAAACVRHLAAKRPRMGQVVRAFDSMAAEDLTNGMRVGESQVFNSAQQSEEIRLFRRMAFRSQRLLDTVQISHDSLKS